MNVGSIVYRPACQQTYVVVGTDENGLLQLKNLNNLSSEIVAAKRDWVVDYPPSWKYYDYYKYVGEQITNN